MQEITLNKKINNTVINWKLQEYYRCQGMNNAEIMQKKCVTV